MCGIAGTTSLRSRVDLETIVAMCDTLKHRGPDDRGAWLSPDGRVAFGHRRLSVIDLSPLGHQPMVSSDGALCITFNGEIYNYRELKKELEDLGHRFKSRSDTEVLLASYREWETNLLERIQGMFAFALWDARHQRLLLARDRAGEKPLFYHYSPSSFSFASELKALMSLPDLSRRLDLTSFNHYLAFGYVPGERCILQGFHKLAAGQALTYDLENDSIRKWRYWSLPEPAQISGKIGAAIEESFVDELEGLLKTSVMRQLNSDVPVGVLLSGGVDSSIVTAMAATATSRLNTFTVRFPGHGVHDETRHARLVSEHFGTNHVELVAQPASVELLPQLARQFDEPMADSSMVPTYLVSQLIRQEGITVALGGDGADELFGGYMHHSWVQIQERARAWIPGPLRRMMGKAASTQMPVGMRGRNWILGFSDELAQSIATINTYFDHYTRSRLLSPLSANSDLLLAPETFKRSLCERHHTPLQQTTRVDFLTYLPDDILVKIDRSSMLASLETRAPFLDKNIIELAQGSIPDSLRATPSARKILLRRIARRILPPAFDVRRKQGFSIPLASWFNGPWGRFMEAVLHESDPALMNRAVISELIEGQRQSRSNTHRLYALTMLKLWRRHYSITY